MAIVSVSAETFSGGRELAIHISEQLGYKLVSRDEVIGKAGHYGMSSNRLERARRRHVGILGRMDLGWNHYLVYVRAALSKEIRHGDLVYIGDDGRAPLSDFPNVLNVSVVADIEYRIDNLMRRTDYGINQKRAKRLIKNIDETRDKWRRTIYEEWLDHEEFDLLIDPVVTGIPSACELIRATVEQPQFRTTPRSLETIELLTAAAELRARIAMDPDVVDDHIEIEARDGALVVTGSVASTQDLEAIRGLLV